MRSSDADRDPGDTVDPLAPVEDPTVRPVPGRGSAGSARPWPARVGRAAGRPLRRVADRVIGFTTGDGAGESGLARLIGLQFVVAAGDAAIAVSLAGTLFFSLPTDQARPQVAQFLLLTMAPFAIVAPLLGPLLDRFRWARRWAIGVAVASRAFLSWVLAGLVAAGSTSPWVFVSALSCLVASKTYTITRASAVPRLLPSAYTLVRANSRISMANVVGASVGGVVAFGVSQLGSEWSLRLGFAIFIAATVIAILLSPRVDAPAGDEVPESVVAARKRVGAGPDRPGRRFRDLSAGVRHGLRCTMGARLTTGFLTLFLAFLLRERPIADLTGTVALGLVVAAAGLGNSLGTVIGNLLRRVRPERIAAVVVCADAAMAAATAAFYSVYTVLALGLVAGLCAQLAKLSYDALVQRDVEEMVRTAVFARSEAVLQLSWVLGGGLGISLPLVPWLGFGVVAVLLTGVLVWSTVAWRRITRSPAAG